MSLIEKLTNELPNLTKNEKILAQYIIDNPIDVIRYNSADKIAEINNCSRASLIRLTQKIGFSGFAQFKNEFAKEMINHIDTKENTILDYYSQAINIMNGLYTNQSFIYTANTIKNSKHVYTAGYAHSSYSAMQLAFRLNRSNIQATNIDHATDISEISGLNEQNSCLVVISISGGLFVSHYLESIKDLYEKNTARIILLTMTNDTPYEKYSHHVIKLPCVSRMCKSSIIDDAAVFYLAIEMIIDALNK